jgi:hypothetical protein
MVFPLVEIEDLIRILETRTLKITLVRPYPTSSSSSPSSWNGPRPTVLRRRSLGGRGSRALPSPSRMKKRYSISGK